MRFRNLYIPIAFGLLGAALMAASDWLMVFGDPTPLGAVSWLTAGAAAVGGAQLNVAMALSVVSALAYGIGLFGLGAIFPKPTRRLRWVVVTALSMTPWLCLHFLCIAAVFLLGQDGLFGSTDAAVQVAEAFYGQFSWLPVVCVLVMSMPFLYFPWLVARGKSALPRWMALSNPLLICAVLALVPLALGPSAFQLAFTNGLMNEALFVWFLTFLPFGRNA